ncbi:MAG: peptidase [Methylobacter sp.]|nr:MAG: peptidase [Methylobacter sp.]
MTRYFWVLVHRYTGLYIAFFLFVAGLSGSVLAFYHELDAWLNPLERVAAQSSPMLDPFTLRERALALNTRSQINSVSLAPREVGAIYTAVIEPLPSSSEDNSPKIIKLNPYTGEAIPGQTELIPTSGLRYWPLTRKNILPFITELHYSLVVGEIGIWLFGIAATLWTVDCFVGFYLTLPPPKKKSPATASVNSTNLPNHQRSFWQRWQIAWKIKWRGSNQRRNFDLHRAGGLWTWAMLLVFAWSSVYLNMLEPVYTPIMKQFSELTDFNDYPIADLPRAQYAPAVDFRAAYPIAKQLMHEQAKQKGFTVLAEQKFLYDPLKGLYLYWAVTDRDVSTSAGSSLLWLDAKSGAFVALYLPTGEKTGDTITNWLGALHMARIGGLPYQMLVCLIGLTVAMLSVTGVYLWLKKQQAIFLKHKG